MNDDDVTVDDIFVEIEKNRTEPRGKVAIWLDQNPEKSEVFWAACRQARERGSDLTAVIKACKTKLGGPPGSDSTVRIAVNEQLRQEDESG